MNNAPLNGCRVVDFTHVISGPFTTQILADLGADVTKIEDMGSGDVGRGMQPSQEGMSHYFACFNRNKRSIALNLKSQAGHEVAMRLIRDADVLVENFAPGVIGRLGFSYEAVRVINPSIVYCSISGFGQTGPLAHKRSLDLVAQAYAGIMSTNGTADGPPLKVGVPIGDTGSSLFAAIGIISAMYDRKTTGAGRYLDVAMYDGLLALLANHGGYYHFTGTQPQRVGSAHYFSVPYGTFPTADGEVVIAVFTDASWAGLCQALEIPQLGQDPRFATGNARSTHRDALHEQICPLIRQLTSADLQQRLESHNVPCAPVNDVACAMRAPHTQARGMVMELTHPVYGTVPVTSLPIPSVMRQDHRAPPLHGEHTVQVLGELGYTDAQIDAIRREMAQDDRAAFAAKETP